MASFARGKIEAFVGPVELGAPDDLEAVIVNFIRGAKKYLDIAIQELDNEVIAQALLDAAYRDISIRIFTEQDYLKSRKRPKPKQKNGQSIEEAILEAQWAERRRPKSAKTNRDILTALLRCGVDVKADLNPKIFHQKFIVRDYRNGKSQGKAALLTGSTNFTKTGTQKNLNHVIIFHDYRICRAYAEEFLELMDGTFGELRRRKSSRPKIVNIKGVPVRILFGPDDGPELEIIKQMLKARKRLDFAIFTFSNSSGIDDAMIMLRKADIDIRGVLDKSQGGQDWAATDWLHNEGIQVYLPDKDKLPGLGRLHHKLMVIDDAIVIAGSMNYTQPANEYNDENIFVIGNPYNLPKSKGGPVDHQECKVITNYFRNEIDRIITKSTIYRS
ncbi:MAG TPA: phospholipase [Gammaproteobacteria bacterium]|nr:phospholipase [Gammaproteobacteria bacterium]